MSGILNIIERAYQGTLEEQDDQALWLVHALKKAGGAHQVLLRGSATAYAVPDQTVGELSIGGVPSGHPPRLDQDLAKLIAAGVPVSAVLEDAEERGIATASTVAGINWVKQAEVAGLFAEAERVFAW